MMKFTSEDLMKAMGLKVGDRVKTKDNFIFEIVKNDFYFLKGINIPENRGLEFLIGLEVDIVPRPKRVGDLDINDKDIYYNYKLTPLLDYKSNLCDWGIGVPEPKNLYEVLEHWQKYNKDQEIYNLLKARLDKEVKENGNMD